jgi:inorganic pyrophosphatase
MTVHLWHELSHGDNAPEVINVVVEIPRGSRNKYEYDKESGAFFLDRVLYSPMHYPAEYGFMPQSYYDDGDPLDVLVLMNQPTFPGCVIEARPVAIFSMIDSGEGDDKILAVPANDPYFANVKDIQDVSPHYLREVEHFFQVYKDLQNKKVESRGWEGAAKALERVAYSIELYKQNREKLLAK